MIVHALIYLNTYFHAFSKNHWPLNRSQESKSGFVEEEIPCLQG